jgi:DNA-binding FadR family transcriptional regulator
LSAAGHEVLHVPARRTHRERRRQGPGKTRSGRRAADVIPSMLGSRGGGRIAFARVQEVRRLLEVEIAGLAAERRSAEDLRDLDALLRRSAEAQMPRNGRRPTSTSTPGSPRRLTTSCSRYCSDRWPRSSWSCA